MKTGPNNLITDVAGLVVGNAADEKLKSGTTVLMANEPFFASVDVRGGAPGTRETDLLAPDKLVDAIDALVLSGGSAFGLDACSGVVDKLHSAGRGFKVGNIVVPLVSGAIVFDLLNGGDKDWVSNPYAGLGQQAYTVAAENFELGTAGAGVGATTADLKGGLGSASVVMPNGVTVGALVVVNARGSVITSEAGDFWAAPFEVEAEFGNHHTGSRPSIQLTDTGLSNQSGENTTIAIVATDAALSVSQLKRLATVSHDGIARAVVPAHTLFDGDLVYALSTNGALAASNTVTPSEEAALGHAAAICLSRAIARGVFEAVATETDTVPCWKDKYSL